MLLIKNSDVNNNNIFSLVLRIHASWYQQEISIKLFKYVSINRYNDIVWIQVVYKCFLLKKKYRVIHTKYIFIKKIKYFIY